MPHRFIEKLSAFASLDLDDIAALTAATAFPREVGPKCDLIREGDTRGQVFVILQGWACRYKLLPNGTRQILAYLLPGDCCDLHIELCLEMDHSIQTITSASVATIERAQMIDMMGRSQVAKAMYVAQMVDEGSMRAWITNIGRREGVERLAHLICELYRRARDAGLAESPTFKFPLSQVFLADSLGFTTVHLNRLLKELRLAGAMTLGGGKLSIPNPAKLAHIAGFDETYLYRRARSPAYS